jgi:molecular chaperone HtpG
LGSRGGFVDTQKRQFQLNLPGLLKVLAEHLYSNRKVALRELIQNAHDSIVRYQISNPSAAYVPRIVIRTDPARHTISIEDNGAGMTDADIITYLTTIGNSYTREFGSQVGFKSPEQASQLIGQFGLGFLSAFLIASDVSLRTRTRTSPTGWRWYCDASEYYEMTPDNDTALQGTVVELTLKPEAEFLLEPEVLTQTIRQYADFLGVPIYLNDSRVSINLITPPWETHHPAQAIRDYIDRSFRLANPIHIIELHDHTVDLGHDVVVIPMKGFVFIPPSSVVSLREYGDLAVYIRRMFITDNEQHLLPPWARFFRGVIDCSVLQPTASRETIHQEDTFLAVQKALEFQLLEGLRQVARDKPEVWRQIILTHTDLILGWLTVNNEFFDQVAQLLPLRTSRGMLTLSEYLRQTSDTLYYVTQQIGSLQEQLLGEGYEVPVIDASWFAVRPFLEKYASRQGSVRLVQLDGDARRLMKPISDSTYDALLAFFKERGVKVKIAAYKPVAVPALMLYPRYASTLNEARRALDADELSSPFADLIEQYVEERMKDEDSDPAGALYLNAACPLIQRLPRESEVTQQAVLTLIYQVARLFAGRTLTPQDAAQAFSDLGGAIQGLMS